MASFYQKYQHLFMSPQRPIKHNSYLQSPPIQRLFKSDKKKEKSFSLKTDNHYDMFKEEILPKLNRLNLQRQFKQKRIRTQEFVPQFQYSVNNPEKNLYEEDISLKNHSAVYQHEKKKSSTSIFRNKKIDFKKGRRRRPSIKIQSHDKTKYQIKIQKPIQPQAQAEPQSSGLFFSEYQKNNQYIVVNERLNDIRKACKFKPRGFINNYKEAIMRRVEAKEQLQDRRRMIKQIFDKEKQNYVHKLPLI